MLPIAVIVVVAIVLWPARGSARLVGAASHRNGGLPGSRSAESRGEEPGPGSDLRPLLTDIADATDLLALALSAGGNVPDALESVARVSPQAVAQDLRRVGAALRWGRDMREAWGFVGSGWSATGIALVVSTRCGAPASEALGNAAARVREHEARRLESAAARAGVLLVLPLGAFFLPAFIATSIVPILLVLLGESLR